MPENGHVSFQALNLREKVKSMQLRSGTGFGFCCCLVTHSTLQSPRYISIFYLRYRLIFQVAFPPSIFAAPLSDIGLLCVTASQRSLLSTLLSVSYKQTFVTQYFLTSQLKTSRKAHSLRFSLSLSQVLCPESQEQELRGAWVPKSLNDLTPQRFSENPLLNSQ